MKNIIRNIAIVGLAIGLLGAAANAAAPPAAPAKGAFQRDLLGVYSDAEKKTLDLEEAVPQNKFDWRPAPGVRSIAEAYLHIAFGNYAVIKFATGKEPPAEVGFEMNPAKWDKKSKDKAEIKKILEASFAHAHNAIAAVSDADLDKTVSFFGHDMSVRAVLIALSAHLNEHLGQSIAYARANKITPPWSKEEKANEKAHMAEKKP